MNFARWKYFWILLTSAILVLFTSCRGGNIRSLPDGHKEAAKGAQPVPPPGYQPATPEALTTLGENFDAQFSPDGQMIAFVSRGRQHHSQEQIYLYNLSTRREKRLTFQDGQTAHPVFHPTENILFYSSTTDEIKENPEFILQALSQIDDHQAQRKVNGEAKKSEQTQDPNKLLSLEIYSSSLDGNNIRRWTIHPGFDGQPAFHPGGKILTFASERAGQLALYSLDLLHHRYQAIANRKPASHHDWQPAVSPDGRWLAWIRKPLGKEESQLMISGTQKMVPLNLSNNVATYLHPRFSPDNQRLIFSSNRVDGNFELYTVNLDGSCLQRLTYDRGDDLHPSFSPDGKKILFTSHRTGRPQIYLMDYLPPKSCPESQL